MPACTLMDQCFPTTSQLARPSATPDASSTHPSLARAGCWHIAELQLFVSACKLHPLPVPLDQMLIKPSYTMEIASEAFILTPMYIIEQEKIVPEPARAALQLHNCTQGTSDKGGHRSCGRSALPQMRWLLGHSGMHLHNV